MLKPIAPAGGGRESEGFPLEPVASGPHRDQRGAARCQGLSASFRTTFEITSGLPTNRELSGQFSMRRLMRIHAEPRRVICPTGARPPASQDVLPELLRVNFREQGLSESTHATETRSISQDLTVPNHLLSG